MVGPEVIGEPRSVAQMFSFLETMRLQGSDARREADPEGIAQLCELLSLAGRSPPGLHST